MPASVVLSDKAEGVPFSQAFVIVTVAPGGPANAADRARFAQDLINSGPVRDLAITSGETMRVKGMPGNVDTLLQMPWSAAVTGLGFALLTACVAGFFPALRVKRLNVVDALAGR